MEAGSYGEDNEIEITDPEEIREILKNVVPGDYAHENPLGKNIISDYDICVTYKNTDRGLYRLNEYDNSVWFYFYEDGVPEFIREKLK